MAAVIGFGISFGRAIVATCGAAILEAERLYYDMKAQLEALKVVSCCCMSHLQMLISFS